MLRAILPLSPASGQCSNADGRTVMNSGRGSGPVTGPGQSLSPCPCPCAAVIASIRAGIQPWVRSVYASCQVTHR